jgi:hypothetical protein
MTPDDIARLAAQNDQAQAAYCDQVVGFYAAVFKSLVSNGLERLEALALTQTLLSSREATRAALLTQDEINQRRRSNG